MSKELLKGELADWGLGYEVKIEEGEVKISAKVSLLALVDQAAKAVPGDNPVEVIVVQLAKQALLAL